MSEKVYPEWVQRQKTKGTTVKKVGNNYYLYKHSSKRVPGKKNPVPVDTYIGKITPDGIQKSGAKKVDTNDTEVIVKEFGFSFSMGVLCPLEWKEALGKNWQAVLDYIIVMESPESYLPMVRAIPDALEPHIQYGAQKASLQRRIRREYGVGLKDLKTLSTIYLVRVSGKDLISKVSNDQKKLLEDLGIRLEVC